MYLVYYSGLSPLTADVYKPKLTDRAMDFTDGEKMIYIYMRHGSGWIGIKCRRASLG